LVLMIGVDADGHNLVADIRSLVGGIRSYWSSHN
jgi:hypothetical protein